MYQYRLYHFFFSSRRRHTRCSRDWSSDVCSSDLVDRLRRLDDAGAEPLLRPTKGAHVAVPRKRVGHTLAVTLTSPIDGRVMFVLPWGDLSYIGTTDTDEAASPDEVRATAQDVVYLLRSVNAFFPHARLSPSDVIASWAGLRPLLRPPRDLAPSAASREHRVIESPSGLWTIAGGELTTCGVPCPLRVE